MTVAAMDLPSDSPGAEPHSQSRSPQHAPSSIFITFKVAQLVNTFRRRVKTRVLSRTASSKHATVVEAELCQEFEKQAFAEIDRYLGRRTTRGHGKRHFVNRKSKVLERDLVGKDASNDAGPLAKGWQASLSR